MKIRRIAASIMESIIIIFTYLGYYAEIRPYFESNLWLQGFLDGAIMTATVFLAVFYVASLFEKPDVSSPTQQKVITKEPKKMIVKPEYIEEMINRCEKIQDIINNIYQRAGRNYFMAQYSTIEPSEENESKEQINWLAQHYPKIASELSQATKIDYYEPVRGIRVSNYDPLLQIINNPSLRLVLENSVELEDFVRNLNSGIARLRAYLGLISKK